MTDDDRRLGDFAHALRMEVEDVWREGGAPLKAGEPGAVQAFRHELTQVFIEARQRPRDVVARHEAALAASRARATGRTPAASNVPAPPRDLGTLAARVYARRAETVREAAAASEANVPDASGGGIVPADVYARRVRETGVD
jgi:hypothetical protein